MQFHSIKTAVHNLIKIKSMFLHVARFQLYCNYCTKATHSHIFTAVYSQVLIYTAE